jgi:hypothetical protein
MLCSAGLLLAIMTMGPITSEKALEIARARIASIKSQHEYVLLEKQTQEHDFGWVFFYTTRKHAETGNPKDMVPGDGPLVVERETGHTEFLSTSLPPSAAIAAYKKRKKERADLDAAVKKPPED